MVQIRVPALERFRETFSGEVILPGDDGYDAARVVWNGVFDRRPALIVRPAGVDDVQSAVRYAREQDLLIAVRGGGHSMSGLSTCDDGIVIDLSRMRGVTVDPEARTARASGGAHLSELDREAQAYGLVCPVGIVGHTGVGGLTLGGGMGRLQRQLGYTIDNLLAVDLVTADGGRARASDRENPELFWAMRGAGANFGVVTGFEFRLSPLAPDVTRGVFVLPVDRVQEAWAAFRELSEEGPRELAGVNFAIGLAGPPDDYPPEVQGRPIVVVACLHTGSVDEATRDLASLLAIDGAVDRSIRTMRYLELQSINDEVLAWGHRMYTKGGFGNDLRAATLDALVDHVVNHRTQATGDWSFGMLGQGGAVRDIPEDDTAFTGRSATFQMSAEVWWDDPAEDEAAVGWGRRAMAIAAPDAVTGRYVNDVADTGTDPDSIYGDAKHRRLVAVKRQWDPDNAFRLNQNIKP